MARELQPLDITDQPDLVRLAQEVQATRTARILRRGNEDLVIVTPVARARHGSPRAGTLRSDDSLFKIVGMAASSDAEPTDVSSNTDTYLAEAYAKHGR